MRWRRRPEKSNWGDFGEDDEAGRLNLLTPQKVREGIAEVREGRTFCLSLPLDYPGGNVLHSARHPPKRRPAAGPNGAPRYLHPLSRDNPDLTDVVCDDQVLLHTQYSTQWDSFAHMGSEFDADGDGAAEAVFYNGWRGGEDIVASKGQGGEIEGTEAKRLGIEKMAERCVQGRAVLIDLHALVGDTKADIGFDGLEEAMKAQGAAVETGDMVCLHTGFGLKIMEMGGKPDPNVLHNSCAALDGRDEKLQDWVIGSGAVALISDNFAVERYPNKSGSGRRALLPLHELCLFKLGIPLGELWWLSELNGYMRAAKRTRFLLTAPPLRLPGAVGSPVTPIATV
ncbi:MAG TPA: cyclase family protein [Hyphomicrobiales bacterium]|nr:cyclase family protein [Hyphomicrobiales bacterium]